MEILDLNNALEKLRQEETIVEKEIKDAENKISFY